MHIPYDGSIRIQDTRIGWKRCCFRETKAALVAVFLLSVLNVSPSFGESAPTLAITPALIDFGTQAVDTTARSTLTVENTGTHVFYIRNVSLNGSTAFRLTAWKGPIKLRPSQSLQLAVSLEPTARHYLYRDIVKLVQAARLVHYTDDNCPEDSPGGTMYFYHNTIWQNGEANYRWQFYDTSPAGASCSPTARPITRYSSIRLTNNAIKLSPASITTPYFYWSISYGGFVALDTNWISSSWGTGTGAGADGDGTANDSSYLVLYQTANDAHHVTGISNLLTGTGTPFNASTYVPISGSPLIGAAVALPSAVASALPVTMQYNPATYLMSPRATTADIGAENFVSSSLILSGVTGLTQCPQANSSGVVSGTGSACGSGGGGNGPYLYASVQSGADACAKIQTAINTQNTAGGGVVIDDISGSQTCAAGFTVLPTVMVRVEVPTTLTVGASIIIENDAGLVGYVESQGWNGFNVQAKNSLNSPVIIVEGVSSGDAHNSRLQYVHIYGNKANNTSAADCLAIHQIGEGVDITNIGAQSCAGYAIHMTSTVGGESGNHNLGRWTVDDANLGFVFVDTITGIIHIDGLHCTAETGNSGSPCLITKAGSALLTVRVTNLQAEQDGISGAFEPLIETDGTYDQTNLVIEDGSESSGVGTTNFIKNVNGCSTCAANLQISNFYISGSEYPNLYNDTVNKYIISTASVVHTNQNHIALWIHDEQGINITTRPR